MSVSQVSLPVALSCGTPVGVGIRSFWWSSAEVAPSAAGRPCWMAA